MNNINALFLSLARDCQPSISKNIKSIRKIGNNYFNKYDILVYSNDNTDKTLEELQNNRVDCVSANLDIPRFPENRSIERADHMAMLRNKLLNLSKEYSNIDKVIMFDMDLANIPTDFSSMLNNTYEYVGSTGKTIFNGVNVMYDIWSFLMVGETYYLNKLRGMPRPSGIMKVKSCFGGLCIYDYSLVYNNYFAKYGLCEHGGFCSQINTVGMNTEYCPTR